MKFDIFRLEKEDRLYAKGSVEFLVNKKSMSTCAFSRTDNVQIRVRIPRSIGTLSASLEFYYESCKKVYKRLPLVWSDIENGEDIYTQALNDFRVGLYFYRIVIENGNRRVYGNGKTRVITFTEDEGQPTLQYMISDFLYPAPKSEYGGIIYHIFVDRFAKGGNYPPKPGTIVGIDYSDGIPEYPEYPGAPLKNNTYWGGTITGIIQKLPYLSELGVTLIYLSPVFESPSNHKYDTADYMRVDSMFGGEEALQELIDKSHELGMGIILDGVFNHTGSDSIYFNRFGTYDSIGAYQSKASKYYPWYNFQNYPDKYTCWWGIDILPRINPDEKSLSEFFTGPNGVIQKYRKMGIRGFRLDVVDELSDAFISKIKATLSEDVSAPSILYGEVWEDASNKIAYETRKKYYLGAELDGVMNYPVREGIISYLKHRDTSKLEYALVDVLENTPTRILHMQMNLLGSHDTERIITTLCGEDAHGHTNSELRTLRLTQTQRENGRKKLCMAYTILATIPGVPSIYYGDESGLEGYSDPFNRMPFPWDNIDNEIRNHYIKLGQIRKNHSVYQNGDFKIIHLDSDFFAFYRTLGKQYFITLINNSDKTIHISTTRKHLSLFDDKTRNDSCLSPFSSLVIRVPSDSHFEFNFEVNN